MLEVLRADVCLSWEMAQILYIMKWGWIEMGGMGGGIFGVIHRCCDIADVVEGRVQPKKRDGNLGVKSWPNG